MVENSKRKEEEVVKTKELSETYKAIFENLNSEKEILLRDNQKMTKELVDGDLFSWRLGRCSPRF